MNAPPKRIENHRIDTLAVRRLMSVLNEDWIIRDLSERDYGIDLMVEYFEGEVPTGKTAFFQIKGKRDPIRVSRDGFVTFYDFPVKTLLYAEHFPEPFFLMHLSIVKDQPIYYLWLQKYIQVELDRHQPNWRKESEINLRIPGANSFLDDEARVLVIASRNVMLKKAMRFLTDFYYWDRHIDDLIEVERMEAKNACVSFLKKFASYRSFFKEMAERYPANGDIGTGFNSAITHIQSLQNVHSDYETRDWLRNFRSDMSKVVDQVMAQEDIEKAVLDLTGEAPY
jgi:hypothetical protein